MLHVPDAQLGLDVQLPADCPALVHLPPRAGGLGQDLRDGPELARAEERRRLVEVEAELPRLLLVLEVVQQIWLCSSHMSERW